MTADRLSLPRGAGRLGADARWALSATRALAVDHPLPVPPDGTGWAEAAQHQGVLGVLLAGLARQGDLPPAAAPYRRVLVQDELVMRADLAAVGRVLGDAGVVWLVLKGLALSASAHPPGSGRSAGDVDVLVAPSQFPAALSALEAAGAFPVEADWASILRRQPGELTLRMPAGTLIDLHWHVVNDPAHRAQVRMPAEELLASRRRVATNGLAFDTLDELDLVLHVALHAARSGGLQLRWMLDLQRCLSAAAPDPGELFAKARSRRVEPSLAVMVDVAARWLGPAVPTRYRRKGTTGPWRLMVRAGTAASPPGLPHTGRRSGQIWFSSTRSTTVSSLRQFAIGAARLSLGRTTTPGIGRTTATDTSVDARALVLSAIAES